MESRLMVHLIEFGTMLAMAALVMIMPAAASQGPTVDTSFEKDLWAIKYHDQWQTPVTLHVNNANAQASDENPGTVARPLKTIQRAIDLSTPGTRILIQPGTYRESLLIPKEKSGTEKAPLVIEAAKKGSVIVSGSDVWQEWAPTETPGIYSRDWPYKFGLSGHHFPGIVENEPLGRRQEMVFVDGKLYRQVMEQKEMEAGTYRINDEAKRILVCFPEKLRQEEHLIEVTVRATGLGANAGYYVVRGLVFQHFWGGSNAFGSHFLVEDCRFEWNNGGGLGSGGKGYVLRRNTANHNGFSGMGTPPTPDFTSGALYEDNETSYNNWRGKMGDYFGYSIGGFKGHFCANIIVRNHRCIDNACPGFWFDNNNRNISFEGGVFRGNLSGIFIEISPGPVRISKCTIVGNKRGVYITHSAHITVEDNILYDNYMNQIDCYEPEEDREGYFTSGIIVRNNVIVCGSPWQQLISRTPEQQRFDTFTSGRNLWYNPKGSGFRIGASSLDFAGWIARTHQDTDSIMAEPRFRDPKHNDFTLLPDSPFWQRAKWGRRACVIITPQRYFFDASAEQIFMSTRPVGLEVRYTLDGTEPTADSPLYTGVIRPEQAINVAAKVFSKDWKDCPTTHAFLLKTKLPAPDVFLSDLKLISNTVDGEEDAPGLDTSILGSPIGIYGIPFKKGLGVQGDSEVVYEIKPEYKRFVAFIGIDNWVENYASPNAIFKVFADEKLLFESAVMHTDQPPVEVDAAIPEGSKKLRLEVKGAGKATEWNSANWARAGFLTK